MRSLLLAVALVAAAGCINIGCAACGVSWRFSGRDAALYDAIPAANGTATRYSEHSPRGFPLDASEIEAAWGEATLVEIGWSDASPPFNVSHLSILVHPPHPDLPSLVVWRDEAVAEPEARARAAMVIERLWSIDEPERDAWLDELFSRPVVMGQKSIAENGAEPVYEPSAWSYSTNVSAPDRAQALYDAIASNATLSEDSLSVASQESGNWTLIYAFPIRHFAVEEATPNLYVTANSHGALDATLNVADRVDEAGARAALRDALAAVGIHVDVGDWNATRLG